MNKKLNDATKHIKMQGQSLDFGGRAIINAKLINCEGAGGGGSDPNAVKYTEQSLTDSQKAQARTNIGAGSAADVSANAAAIAAETSRAVTAEGTLQEMISAIDRGEGIVAWDGASTPVEAEIPAGVTVTYNNVTYTGTLAASSDTKGPVYYVADGNGNATRYMVSQSGSTYSWLAIGTTEIDLSQYATKAELSQLDQKVDDPNFRTSNPVFSLSLGTVSWLNGNEASSNSVKKSTAISVSGYDYVEFVGSSPASWTASSGAAFYDANGAFLSALRYDISGTDANSYKKYRLRIPAGAATFKFSIYNTFEQYAKVTLIKGSTTPQDIEDAFEGELQKDVIGVVLMDGNTYGSWRFGYITATSGAFSAQNGDNMSTDYIDISGYKKIRLLMSERANVSTTGLAFYDSTKQYIYGYAQFSGAESDGAKVREVFVPANAKYIRTSILKQFRQEMFIMGVISNYGERTLISDAINDFPGDWQLHRLMIAGNGVGAPATITTDNAAMYVLSNPFPVKMGDVIYVQSGGAGIAYVAECDSDGNNLITQAMSSVSHPSSDVGLYRYEAETAGSGRRRSIPKSRESAYARNQACSENTEG